MKSEFTQINFDFINLKLDSLRMKAFFIFFQNGLSTHGIQFPDYANWFFTYVNHFPTYEIEYHVTKIKFSFDEITFLTN